MSETVLFGKVKDPELIFSFSEGCCSSEWGGGPFEAYPKFWILNPVAKSTIEFLRIPAWKKSFDFVKKELDSILERDVLPFPSRISRR